MKGDKSISGYYGEIHRAAIYIDRTIKECLMANRAINKDAFIYDLTLKFATSRKQFAELIGMSAKQYGYFIDDSGIIKKEITDEEEK